MTTPVQTFDLYDLGGSTAADMYSADDTAAKLPISSGELTGVISQILDDNKEAIIAMDLTRADHREYLAGTISHAMLDRSDVRVIAPNNTSEDK